MSNIRYTLSKCPYFSLLSEAIFFPFKIYHSPFFFFLSFLVNFLLYFEIMFFLMQVLTETVKPDGQGVQKLC